MTEGLFIILLNIIFDQHLEPPRMPRLNKLIQLFGCLLFFVSASTLTAQISLLAEQDFESGFPPIGWTGDFDTNTTFDEFWVLGSGPSTSGHMNTADPTGPSGAFAGSQYLYFEASGPAGVGATSSIQTPSFTVSGANPTLTFFLFMHGVDIKSLMVNAMSGTGPTLLATYTGERQTSKTDSWEQIDIDLSAFDGQTISIEFMAMKNVTNLGDIAIDNVSASATPPPLVPTLSQWAIVLLFLLLLIGSIVALKEKTPSLRAEYNRTLQERA